MTSIDHPEDCSTNTHNALTQEHLKRIVTYDPVTTKLVPVNPQPQLGLTATKFGQRHLLIGSSKISMANLAYLYHHGESLVRVTHKDGNNLNFAPDNLIPYKPTGRPKHLPVPHAVKDEFGNYIPAFKPPLLLRGTPTVSWVLATAADGTALGYYQNPTYAKRVAADNITNISPQDLLKLGAVTEQDIANIDK